MRSASAVSWPGSLRSEPEVHGLVALMEIQASRARARVGPSGRAHPAPRSEPRALGSAPHPPRPRRARALAEALGGARRAVRAAGRDRRLSRARAHRAEDTDWTRIAELYEALARLAPSPVVELNRAVAVAMAFGPAAGLARVDALVSEPSLAGYHLLPSVRGDLLAKLGRFDEARAEFETRGGAHAECCASARRSSSARPPARGAGAAALTEVGEKNSAMLVPRLASRGPHAFDKACLPGDDSADFPARCSRAPGSRLVPPETIVSPESRLSYRVDRMLGEGGYGQAYLATRLGRSRSVPAAVCIKASEHIDGWLREAYFGQLLDGASAGDPGLRRVPAPAAGPAASSTASPSNTRATGDLRAFLHKTARKWPEPAARREIAGILQVLQKAPPRPDAPPGPHAHERVRLRRPDPEARATSASSGTRATAGASARAP
mgnify:CR=1 FL=1